MLVCCISPPPNRGRTTPAVRLRITTRQPKPQRQAFPQVAAPAWEARCRLQTCGTPRRPEALQSPRRCPAPRQDPQAVSFLSRRDGAHRGPRSRAGDSSVSPTPSRRLQSLELRFLLSHRSYPPALGGRAAPLARPEEERVLAWVLPARNRFLRDLLPFSQGPAEAGRQWKPAVANGDANRYPHFPPLFPSPRPKPSPPHSGRNLKVSLSLTLSRRHRSGGNSRTSPLPPRAEMAAVCLGC